MRTDRQLVYRQLVMTGVLALLWLTASGAALAFRAPDSSMAPAPDFDIRGALPRALPSDQAPRAPTPAQTNSLNALKRAAKGLEVRWSALTEAPSRIGSTSKPLTGPSTGDKKDVALEFLTKHAALLDLSGDDVGEMRFTRELTTALAEQGTPHHRALVAGGAALEVDAGQCEQQEDPGTRLACWQTRRGSGVTAGVVGGGGGKQVAGVREARADVDGGEEAEVADLHEAGREDVLEEAADEFDGRTCRAGAPAGAKDDGVSVEVDQAAVRDGDAMGVVAEIAKDLLRSAEGPLGVHDPALVVEALASSACGAIIGVVIEVALGEQRGETRQKFPSKESTEDMHREEKIGRCRNPPGAVEGEPPARDDAVDVRMKRERARPGVEDRGHRQLRGLREPLGVAGERSEGRGGALEEGIQAAPDCGGRVRA